MDLIAVVSFRTWIMLGCIAVGIVVWYVTVRRRSQANYSEKSQP